MIHPAPTCSSSDADLLTAFVRGRDPAAFSQLVARHGGMVLAVCRSVLGNTSDAEDAAQAVFLTLAQKAPSHRVHGSLAGWLHRVGWYVAARSARARAIRHLHEQEAARMKKEFSPPPDAAGDPIPLDLLHAGLADLPEKYRVPLLLHHLEGRTQEETAALLGCGVSAVAMRLNRGRELLRQRLARRGLASSALGLVGALSSQVHGQVSASFVAGTAKAATAVLAGHVTATGLSASALALKQGAIHMLFWSQIKSFAAAFVVMLMVGGVGAMVARQALASAQTAPQPSMTGTIIQVGADSIMLHSSSQTITVTFNTATIVKVDGDVSTAGDLKVGMSAIVFGAANSPAAEIRAYTPKTTTTPPPPVTPPTIAGTITQVGPGGITLQTGTSQFVDIPFDTSTTINVGGKAAIVADLKVGMRAYAVVPTGKPATEIRAYVPTTPSQPAPPPVQLSVSGTISQIGPDSTITLRTSTQNVTVTYNPATTVEVDGNAATIADLKVNMSAIAVGPTTGPAVQIRAYSPKTTTQPTTTTPPATQPNVAGTITLVGTGSITIQTATGPVVVPFNTSTAINVGGKAATAADLKAGMRAYAIVPTGKPATDIRAYLPTTTQPTTPTTQPTVTGTIIQLGIGSITVQTTAGPVVVPYNPATVVNVGGKAAIIGDLKMGMRVYAIVPTGKPATDIRAYLPTTTTQPATPPAAQPNVAGTITQVGAGSITIQTTAGLVVVPFNTATIINVGGKAATVADLKVGMRAYAVVPTGKPATDIRAYVPASTTAP